MVSYQLNSLWQDPFSYTHTYLDLSGTVHTHVYLDIWWTHARSCTVCTHKYTYPDHCICGFRQTTVHADAHSVAVNNTHTRAHTHLFSTQWPWINKHHYFCVQCAISELNLLFIVHVHTVPNSLYGVFQAHCKIVHLLPFLSLSLFLFPECLKGMEQSILDPKLASSRSLNWLEQDAYTRRSKATWSQNPEPHLLKLNLPFIICLGPLNPGCLLYKREKIWCNTLLFLLLVLSLFTSSLAPLMEGQVAKLLGKL